ncbi:filamentous hemagglutinin N-terminal domain-containing protein [Sesbania bispinosa]|nr:filamentous hemagglutinin N-terminal domain-containing protein [Sesbania bispinosa]
MQWRRHGRARRPEGKKTRGGRSRLQCDGDANGRDGVTEAGRARWLWWVAVATRGLNGGGAAKGEALPQASPVFGDGGLFANERGLMWSEDGWLVDLPRVKLLRPAAAVTATGG